MILEAPISTCPTSTLSEGTDEYLINRGIDKKKYYAKYLIIAQRVWQDIFLNTLFVTKNVWQTLKKGDPYDYIDLPKDCLRLFTINTTDHCGTLQPLYYNNQLNVIPQPKTRKCGCNRCDCGGICEDVNAFTVTTKLLFTISGIDYVEKTWAKYCPNGDIWEYSEVPTKKYLDFTGDGGDYSGDYSDDYLTGDPPLANFEVVTQVSQKKLCALTVKPCGCPEDTVENSDLLISHCGCFLPCFGLRRRRHCENFLGNINPNCYGEVKLSECGTKIFYRPSPRHHHTGPFPVPKKPTFLLVNYQTDGKTLDTQTQVPDYALMALWTGIDWRSKMFNGKYSMAEKREAKYAYNEQVDKIIIFLNALSLQALSNIQDAPIRW